MIRRSKYKNQVEVLQGTLDMLILQTLEWGPQHGYGIVQALRTNSGEVLQVETGSLYPALSIDWNVRAGYVPNGSKQRASNVPVTTASRRPARNSLLPTGAGGTRSCRRLVQSCTRGRGKVRHEPILVVRISSSQRRAA